MITKTLSTIVVSTLAIIILSGCGDKAEDQKVVKEYKYSAQEVYAKSCIKCHSANGEGNPDKKTPALNDRTEGEMAQDLYDVKNGGTGYGGSGTDHEIMEHNMQKLIDKGYDYDVDEMAKVLSNLIKK